MAENEETVSFESDQEHVTSKIRSPLPLILESEFSEDGKVSNIIDVREELNQPICINVTSADQDSDVNLLSFDDIPINKPLDTINEESCAIMELEGLSNKTDLMEAQSVVTEPVSSIQKDENLAKMEKIKSSLLILKREKELMTTEIYNFGQEANTCFDNMRKSTQQSIPLLERIYQRDSQEKKELLSEMTSMNEELNRRGETISSLKEVITMYEKKVIDLNSQQDCNLSTIKQLSEELRDRTQRLHDVSNQHETNSNIIIGLREELNNTSQQLADLDNQQNVSNNTIKELRDQLMEAQQLVANQATTVRELEAELAKQQSQSIQGEDHLSTSTVSKVEETGRLRDVEDSFEDRYCKLKVVAVKLKKRATETRQLLDNERQKWTAERSELSNKLSQLNASARNNQTLQQELDKLADELELERKECKMMRKAATDAKTSEVNLKVRLEEAQTNIEILKVNLDSAVKEKELVCQTLASKAAELDAALAEKAAAEVVMKEKCKEVLALEEKLKEEHVKLEEIQKTAENAKKEVRKQSVLSLEIQDYEKSLSDMSSQLTTERGRVSSLEAEVQTLNDIRDSLQEQIKLLEERVNTEEARCEQTHNHLLSCQEGLRAAEAQVADLEGQITQLSGRLESERASAEAATLELSSLSSAVQANTGIMLKEKQDLSQQVCSLTSQLATVNRLLQEKMEELASVQADFDKYKVRAASVLRRHQSVAVSQAESDAKAEADQLRQLADTLTAKLDNSLVQLEQLRGELSVAHRELEAAENHNVSLNAALADKTRLLERSIAEHRSQRLSLETLVQCYKNQLEERETTMAQKTLGLTEELEALHRQLAEQRGAAGASEGKEELTQTPALASSTATTVGGQPPLFEREDGEGSEYIPDYSPSQSPPLQPTTSSRKTLLPLDKLLETNDAHYVTASGDTDHAQARLESAEAECERLRKRTTHQAALLTEAETDAARKEQLIAVLKREIGRLERTIQRQPHAQNTEYLKNIVFKFVTLEAGEDRLRLVPVITTLLQLSPEETHKLTSIAKGESVEGVTWGSYFSSWR